MIRVFEQFCRERNKSGFSMGDGNAKGIFALIDYDGLSQDMLDIPVKWHCGDPEVDPWEWRMRVLEERSDIAYSKLFFKTNGFITKDWYPYRYLVQCYSSLHKWNVGKVSLLQWRTGCAW